MNFEKLILLFTIINSGAVGYLILKTIGPKHAVIKHQIVVDTSGLIDGRILEIVRSGFIPQRIIIPQFVVAELQLLADKADPFKRERARYGLEVVQKLQELAENEVVIASADAKVDTVDAKLVEIAKRYGALLYTTDYNLNQVAQIEGVKVLNVNELAQALRASYLPGERAEIKITQVGQDKAQGVGYLEDGTMVVVEKAGRMVGKKVQVEFSRILQTQAGKMMFATLTSQEQKRSAPVNREQRKPRRSHHSNSETSINLH